MAEQPLALLLASASPRRRELLATAGLRFEVRAADIDETVAPGEAPGAYVERMGRQKAEAALSGASLSLPPSAGLVLAADTIVVADDTILGKPADDADAMAILARLVGRAHRVMTSVALARVGEGLVEALTVSTLVRFRAASLEEQRRYVATGEGRDKAGGYAIQGIGAGFVEGIEGSYTNVVGLPVPETLALLGRHGGLASWP